MQEELDLLKSYLYFSIQSEKLCQFGTFTTFKKIYRSFINNLKLDMTKRQVKAHLFYLANSYSFRYKPSPHVICWYRVLSNFRRNIKTIATKHNKGNTVVWKQYSRNKTMKLEIFLQLCLGKLNQNKFFNEMNIIDCYYDFPSDLIFSCINGTFKIHSFSSNDSFSKL